MGALGGTETGRVTKRTPRVSGHQTRTERGEAVSLESAPGSSPAETTAEIPVVGPAQSGHGRAGWAEGTVRERSAGVLLPDGSVWYPASPGREPAPFLLRLYVWLLLFLVVLGGAGLAVERYHPSWLAFARNTHSGAVVVTGRTDTSSTAQTGTTAPSGGFHLIANSPKGATYATGAKNFTLVLSFAQPVWTVIASPAGSKTYLVEQTLQPNASPKKIIVAGSASVQLSAASKSIDVLVAGKKVGSVADPAVGDVYTFRP